MSGTLAAVKRYLAEGWAVIPIPRGQKGPRVPNWQDTRFTAADFTEDDNIGIALGDPSDGLTDVDLDCVEAVRIAPKFLPPTGRIHGRPSKPASHYWYRAPGSKTEQFKDTNGAIIAEIRSTKGQTVVPPSIHPSGEELTWDMHRDPTPVDTAGLRAIVAQMAVAVILSRHWPDTGSRHAVSGQVAGLLYALKIPERDIVEIMEHVCDLARDDGKVDRIKFVKDTLEKARNGQAVQGGVKLSDSMNEVVKLIRSWFGAVNSGSAVEELNEKHAFIFQQSGDIVILTEDEEDGHIHLRFSKPSDMNLLYPKKVRVGTSARGLPIMKTLGQAWLDSPNRRAFRGIELAPTGAGNTGYYNMWQGYSVEPKKGDWPLFRQHLDLVVQENAEHACYVLAWMAETVQHPHHPIGIALTFRGGQGTGKSTFATWFGELFGAHFLHLDSSDRLLGHFNAHLHNAILVLADEAVWAGGKQGLGALKRMITEKTLAIERKGIDTLIVKNMIHMMVASNESWAVPAELDNRRFAVFDVSRKRQNNRTFFAAVWKELFQQGGLAALLYDLLEYRANIDLHIIPETDALAEQKHLSMKPMEEWWYQILVDGELWEARNRADDGEYRVARDVLYENYVASADRAHQFGERGTRMRLGTFLRKMLKDPYPKTYQQKSTGHRFWVFPPLIECRKLFQAACSGATWPVDPIEDLPTSDILM